MLHISCPRYRVLAALIAALLGLLLAGCESTVSLGKKIDYKSTASTPPLEIPPDLTTPAYDDRYLASTASGAAAAKAAGLLVAAYHFANPANSGGVAQADYALNHGGYRPDGR